MGCPARPMNMIGAVLILLLIWIIAVAAAAPLFMYRSLLHYNINITALDFKHKISYCEEAWPELPLFDGRVYYSIFSIFVQYFIPILVVSHKNIEDASRFSEIIWNIIFFPRFLLPTSKYIFVSKNDSLSRKELRPLMNAFKIDSTIEEEGWNARIVSWLESLWFLAFRGFL